MRSRSLLALSLAASLALSLTPRPLTPSPLTPAPALARWLDYISIPQANRTLQSLSIDSLALYASMPDYFVVVAPPATHVDNARVCNKKTYLRRGWCAHVHRSRAGHVSHRHH